MYIYFIITKSFKGIGIMSAALVGGIGKILNFENIQDYHLVCSGQGIKMSSEACYCDLGYYGVECELAVTHGMYESLW